MATARSSSKTNWAGTFLAIIRQNRHSDMATQLTFLGVPRNRLAAGSGLAAQEGEGVAGQIVGWVAFSLSR